MGNNASCKVVGRGTIKIKMYNSMIRTLTNVKHIPNLKKNLISLGALDEKGYRFKAANRVLKVSKGALVVMKSRKHEEICISSKGLQLLVVLQFPHLLH